MSQPAEAGPANDAPLATFEFGHGGLRGSHLSLFATRLTHRGEDFFEVMPLERIGALRVGFERDAGGIKRGQILFAIALLVLGAYWPLHWLVRIGFSEMNPQSQGGGAFLPAALRIFEMSVAALPVICGVVAVLGVASMAFAMVGNTVLTVMAGAAERNFAVRGRNPALVEFAESVAARLEPRR